MSRASSGRQSATSTSRSRAVSAGGACSTSVAAPAGASGSRNTSRVWPIRISSPCRNRREAQIRSPLTHVPLDEPRSVTHQPAGNRSSTACRPLAVASSSTAMSFSAALPIVERSAASSRRQLRTPEITSICADTPRSLRAHCARREPRADAVQGALRGARDGGLGRRGADRQGAGPPARPLRGAEDPPGARRGGARGAARRGARAAVVAAASGAAAGARGLLRPRRLRRRDGLGRRHRPGDAAGRPRAPGAGAVERAGLSGPGGRGADAPALAVAAGHPRRRQARQPDPDEGRPDQARRLRPVLRAERAAAARRDARLPRPRAGRRRESRRARATSTRSRRPRSRC